MTKLRNRGRASAAPASPRGIDDSVSDLAALANDDRGTQRDRIPRNAEDAEADALPAQREVYERITGRSTKPPARRSAAQRDERPRLDDDEEPEQEINAREVDEDDEDDLDDAGEDEDDEPAARVPKERLDGALTALRRAKAPAWVFEEDPDRIVELAGSFAGYQSDADRVLGSKDETIRALQAALAGRGTQTSADAESHGAETPPEEDLTHAAEGLARALGVEADENARRALLEYGRAARKGGSNPSKAEAREIQRLQATVRDMLLEQGVKGLRRSYSQLRSDPQAETRLKQRAIRLSADPRYENDVPGLFRDAGLLEFGAPDRKPRSGRARAQGGSAPVTQSRRSRRESSAASAGTEAHDRAVFDRVTRGSRSSLATRR